MRRKTKSTNKGTVPLHKKEMVHRHSVDDNSDATTCVSEITTNPVIPVEKPSQQKQSSGFFKHIFSMMKVRQRSERRNKSKELQNNSISKESTNIHDNYETNPPLPLNAEQEKEQRNDECPHGSTPIICDEFSDVRMKYHVNQNPIGRGHYGTVRKCMDRETGEIFAIKSIKKSNIKDPNVITTEIEVLSVIDHPNIVKFVDVHEDSKYVHIITELCTGGELFERIVSKEDGRYAEKDAAKILKTMLEAVAYLHKTGTTHRDLKPENFLFETKDEDSAVKLIDFGLATQEAGELTQG